MEQSIFMYLQGVNIRDILKQVHWNERYLVIAQISTMKIRKPSLSENTD